MRLLLPFAISMGGVLCPITISARLSLSFRLLLIFWVTGTEEAMPIAMLKGVSLQKQGVCRAIYN